MTIRSTWAVVALGLVAACRAPEEPARPAASPTTLPTATAPANPGRALSESARTAMTERLANEAVGRKAWILSQPGNPEVAALVASVSGVFKDAGWEITTEMASGISLKPGLMVLIADEQYPTYVDSVLKAFEASGLDVRSASGYRAYYASKKQETPGWPGVPVRADQDFIIVVGPKPAA
jgi:hypothetical protein